MIIMSGQDLSGKSTVCKKLSKLLDCNVYHFDKPKDLQDGKNQYFNFLNEHKDENVICDRFHEGEWIYAPLYRNYVADYLEEIEEKFKEFPYLFIYLYASMDVIMERYNKRGEDFVKIEDFPKVRDLFKQFLIKQTMPYITICTDKNDITNYMKKILLSIDKTQKLFNYCKDNYKDLKYFGNINCKYLIVSNNIEKTKQKLLNSGIYYDSFVIPKDDDFIKYTTNLLSPKKVMMGD